MNEFGIFLASPHPSKQATIGFYSGFRHFYYYQTGAWDRNTTSLHDLYTYIRTYILVRYLSYLFRQNIRVKILLQKSFNPFVPEGAIVVAGIVLR